MASKTNFLLVAVGGVLTVFMVTRFFSPQVPPAATQAPTYAPSIPPLQPSAPVSPESHATSEPTPSTIQGAVIFDLSNQYEKSLTVESFNVGPGTTNPTHKYVSF
jgi:hypothetical protein